MSDETQEAISDWIEARRAEFQRKETTVSDMNEEQPAPVPNGLRPVWELVREDMLARDRLGRERYGTPLQPFNGRGALRDAYEEALDLCVYLRQAIEERRLKGGA